MKNLEKKENKPWQSLELEEIFKELNSLETGLTEVLVKEAFLKWGKNKLPEEKKISPVVLFLRQFQSPLIYILLLAGVIVLFLGEIVDASVIAAVLLINAIIGFIQEGQAERTLDALKKFTKTNAYVLRDGKESIIEDVEVVPGDIILLKDGDKIPADARLIESHNLKVDESAVTGESIPVLKDSELKLSHLAPVSEQGNMVFKGTFVVSGTGKAIVVLTGSKTFIGDISTKVAGIESSVPLKEDLAMLSRVIAVVVGIVTILLFIAGLFFGNGLKDMFFTAVAVAVSIVPEGLPVVITVILAIGVFRMAKRNALVKRLQAVESLGQADVIAVDKTGTITKNELMVEKVFVGEQEFDVLGNGYDPEGSFLLDGRPVDIANHPELIFSGKIASMCASAKVFFDDLTKVWKVSGEPTEASMFVFGKKVGFEKDTLERENPQILDIPFDSKTKYHATIHSFEGKRMLTAVGAPEVVLEMSASVWKNGSSKKMTTSQRSEFEEKIRSFSSQGLRVLAFAVNMRSPKNISSLSLPKLSMVGLFGIKDVLRQEVSESVSLAKKSGIDVVMITGDHKITAEAIARKAGIYEDGNEVLTGPEIDLMSEADLVKRLGPVRVFARVTPDHKLKIVEAYKKRGDVIAMTGDGVNDALSLVAADLGIAMGRNGTDVARESADIVLLDDNFKSIVAAIEEGRNIYKAIRRLLVYLFSTGLGEFLTIAVALFLMIPLPLLPTQILWLNLITDGFLVISLATEPREKLSNSSRPGRALLDVSMLRRMIIMGLVMMVGTLLLFNEAYTQSLAKGWTVALTSLAVFQWFNIWNCRSETQSIFSRKIFKNHFLVLSTLAVIILQALIIYHPWGQKVFHTVSLSLYEWVAIILVSGSIIVIEEIRKFISRRKRQAFV